MKRFSVVACMLLALVLFQVSELRAQSSEPLNISYPSFSNVSFMTMNGATQQANGSLRLTPATTSTAGSAFYSDRTVDLTQPFHTSFSFFLHGSNTPLHADGVTFTLQSSDLTALGGAGGGLGYAGITPSAAVYFDDFAGSANPTGSQVGIVSGGSISSTVSAAPAFSLYGATVYAWVDYDPATTTLKVYLSRTNSKPATALLTGVLNLASTVGGAAFAGFTGGTGADDQISDITSWQMSGTAGAQSIPPPQLTPGIVSIGGVCFITPYYTYSPTCGLTPIPTSAASRPLIFPNKSLSVSSTNAIAGSPVLDYNVIVTSSVACFSANEPIDLYLLGSPGAGALRPISPKTIPQQDSSHYRFAVDPQTHAAVFSLEVNRNAVGTTGLAVKAVWPEEGIERVQTLFAAATATPTATELPGLPTATPTVTPTGGTPSVPGTPPSTATPTATPTVTPVPAGALLLRTCVDPSPVAAGSSATIFGQTVPGAVCTAAVRFSDGTSPVNFDGSAQTALSDGFVLFPLTASTKATSGRARVTCIYNGFSITSFSNFLILQPGSTGNATLGTLPVDVSVSPSSVGSGGELTIFAQTAPSSQCVATVAFTGAGGIPFNGFAQTVAGNGIISWTFPVQAAGAGFGAAIVDCVNGTSSGEGSAGFTVTG